jgi:hypothetical protein
VTRCHIERVLPGWRWFGLGADLVAHVLHATPS